MKTKYCITVADEFTGNAKCHTDMPFDTRKEAVEFIMKEYNEWQPGKMANKQFMIMSKEKTKKADGEVHLMLGMVTKYPDFPRIKSRWFTVWAERVIGPFE